MVLRADFSLVNLGVEKFSAAGDTAGDFKNVSIKSITSKED
jgi:hypothetical protein